MEEYGCAREEKSLDWLEYRYRFVSGRVGDNFCKVRGPWASHMTTPMALALVMMIVSAPFYLWGCAALARGKGYSSAILLTCILGWLFPVVVLLALPDKRKHHRRW